MTAYLIRRLLLMIPTLFGIMLVSFVVVQFAPGGPVERVIAQLSGNDTGATSRISGSAGGDFGSRGALQSGAQMDGEDFVEIVERIFFDRDDRGAARTGVSLSQARCSPGGACNHCHRFTTLSLQL